uniref:rab11 family-interacting protein 1 n=1 Tax=Doryrhamphus excisus TaxID=161450 RepID=UPI0025AE7E75|nr:rab11 family-interacting protein 1 [Doryrhamphus excisus]
MSSPNEEQRWVPTHVQVTVLRGRGLRGKGKHGTSDVYTVIQFGKEKYSTCVVEKTTEPEWREECSFELLPGVLMEGGGRTGQPAGSSELVLTVMHRALIGLDVFLGQALIQLDKVFQESRGVKNQWYRLNSKTGKKEKERGDIQVSIQFMRNNLTASMYDLVMKDKSASTFSKLKERMRGKRRSSDEDSSSAVLPGGYGSLYRMRQRLPSDGGGEEDYEDDEGGEVRRSKMRTFFLRGKLRKSSDTRSSTSLGSESSESSRGGSLSPTAGISVVVSDLSNSPSNSSNLTADSPEHTADTSPKLSPLRCDFSDDFSEITIAVPQLTVGVNGTHNIQSQDHGTGDPEGSLGLGHLQKTLPLSVSLQNLHPRASTDLLHGTVGDGRRWSFDKAGEEETAAIAAALEKNCPALGGEEDLERKNLLPNGRSETAGGRTRDGPEHSTAAEGKHKDWFGSKELHCKPSLVVSPILDPNTDTPFPPLPTKHHPPLPLSAPLFPLSPPQHSNPFCRSQPTTPTMSPGNPFLSFVQHNPFYEDLATPPLKASLPPLPFLSSSRPPIAQLFPQSGSLNPAQSCDSPSSEDFITCMFNVSSSVSISTGEALSKKAPNPFTPAEDQEPDPAWDESFQAFASLRLLVPKDQTTADQTCESLSFTSACQENGSEKGTKDGINPKASGVIVHCLDPIPEDAGFEWHNKMFSTLVISPTSYPQPEAHQANSIANTNILTSDHPAACHTSCLADPAGSSDLGSSVDEDLLSCLSSNAASDMFSAHSADDTEPQKCESSIPSLEILSESVISSKDRSSGQDLLTGAAQKIVIQSQRDSVKEDWSPGGVPVQTPANKVLQPKPNSSPHSNQELEEQCKGDSSGSLEEFSCAGDEACSSPPSFAIITSSPDAGKSLPFEDMGGHGPVGLFGDLLAVNWQTFDQSSRLNVSADSLDYQSCRSQQSPECSTMLELTEMLDAENATFCEESGELPSPEGSTNGPKNQTEWFTESLVMEDIKSTREPGFTANGDQRLQVLLGTPTDLNLTPSEGAHCALRDDTFLKNPLPPLPTLHRSQSEGTLATALDKLLPLSFSSQCDLDLPSLLTSSATPLPPQSSCFPSFLSSFSDAASPPSVLDSPAPAKPKSQEVQERQQHAARQKNSPHLVKPLSTGTLAEGRSVLEKLKSTIHPGRSSQPIEQEADRKKPLTEGAGSYYHLTHSELIGLLVQREAELERKKAEFQQQKALLAKREVELRRLKPQVRDLEDYIDTLLVRIMEQKPTLLQVRSKLK